MEFHVQRPWPVALHLWIITLGSPITCARASGIFSHAQLQSIAERLGIEVQFVNTFMVLSKIAVTLHGTQQGTDTCYVLLASRFSLSSATLLPRVSQRSSCPLHGVDCSHPHPWGWLAASPFTSRSLEKTRPVPSSSPSQVMTHLPSPRAACADVRSLCPHCSRYHLLLLQWYSDFTPFYFAFI